VWRFCSDPTGERKQAAWRMVAAWAIAEKECFRDHQMEMAVISFYI
jgi:hypothetical protein